MWMRSISTDRSMHLEAILHDNHRRQRHLAHFQSFLSDTFCSESFFITFDTAISKSSCVTWIRLSLSANIPASHTQAHVRAILTTIHIINSLLQDEEEEAATHDKAHRTKPVMSHWRGTDLLQTLGPSKILRQICGLTLPFDATVEWYRQKSGEFVNNFSLQALLLGEERWQVTKVGAKLHTWCSNDL